MKFFQELSATSQKGSAFILLLLGVIVVFSGYIVSGASKFEYSKPEANNPSDGTPGTGTNPASYFLNASLTYNANSATQIVINEITAHETTTTPVDIAKVERTNQLYSEYVLQYVDSANNVLFEKKFDVPNVINTDNGLFGGTGPATVELDTQNFGLSLPVIPDAVSVNVVDNNGNIITQRTLSSQITSLPPPPPFQTFSNSTVNIAFVSAGYSDAEMSLFSSDVQRAKTGILSIAPYGELASSINFVEVKNTTDLSCNIIPGNICIWCDLDKTTQAVANAGVTADTIMIIINSPDTHGGCSFTGSGIASQTNNPNLGWVAPHELSHALVGLLDEYTYVDIGENSALGTYKNCYSGQPPSNEWSSIVDDNSYFQGCTFDNWYRSSEDSLMKSGVPYLNPISIKYVKERFGVYTGNDNNPTNTPTPTNPPNATNTPTPSPTPRLDPPGVGWCANDARENAQSINGGSCDVKNEAKWIPPANPYCMDRFKGQADYFFLCEGQDDNASPTPTQTEVIDNPTCTGPATGPCKGCKNGVLGYIKPRCGQGDSGDFTLPRQGTYCGASYYDVYLCKDGTEDEFRNPAGDSACNSSPWCIAEATPVQNGSPTPTPASYALECPNDGKHVCASTTSCDGLSGYSRKTSGDTICSEYSSGTQPYCCQKP